METDQNTLTISTRLTIPLDEIDLTPIRASGPGGQHVNKVSSAIHLRFDIRASSLPDPVKQRLLNSHDNRINSDGIVVIKAQEERSQLRNREAALIRLRGLIISATQHRRNRVATKPTRASRERRLQGKKQRSQQKALRGKVVD